jgi:hypothetical protein
MIMFTGHFRLVFFYWKLSDELFQIFYSMQMNEMLIVSVNQLETTE